MGTSVADRRMLRPMSDEDRSEKKAAALPYRTHQSSESDEGSHQPRRDSCSEYKGMRRKRTPLPA